MNWFDRITRFRAAALLTLLGVGMLAGAMAFQHLGDLAPCALCIEQRKAWGGVVLFATVTAWAVGRSRLGLSLVFLLLAAIAALVGAGIAGFHVGVEYGWWKGTEECGAGFQGFGGGGSAAELREQLLARPTVRCDEVAWSMLGISMTGWNGLISLAAAAGAAAVAVRDILRIKRHGRLD